MFEHFFKSFTDSAKCNLNIQVEGENEHHKIESIFKAFAKAIKMAVNQSDQNFNLPSTKEVYDSIIKYNGGNVSSVQNALKRLKQNQSLRMILN
jgi:4-diphosphocytidyl-2C-methyl-D-erythritol kinase